MSKMRKVNAFDRKHVVARLLSILNSKNAKDLLNEKVEVIINQAFPIEESYESDIMPQYTKKNKEQAMSDIYELTDQRKGKIWGVFEDVNGMVEETVAGLTGQDLENYKYYIMSSPVNMANLILQHRAHTWVPTWIGAEKLDKQNVDKFKAYLEELAA